MKNEYEVIKAMIRDYKKAISNPKIAKMLLLPRASFRDDLTRSIALALLCNDGNLSHAVQDLMCDADKWRFKMEKLWDFVAWADEVKGGAS